MKLKAFIPTEDLERALAFYRDVVGLEVVSQDQYGAHLRSGDTLVRLTTAKPFQPQPFTVLGWQVTDISIAVRRLTDAGAEFERYETMDQDDLGIWTAPSGDRIAWFADPDGNLLSIDQPT